MSFTDQTQNYGLPQWLRDDYPDWLTDVNNAFAVIDTTMKANALGITNNTSAITTLQGAVNSLNESMVEFRKEYGTVPAQVQGLDQAVQSMQSTLSTMSSQVTANTNSIQDLSSSYTTLSGQYTTLANQVNSLNTVQNQMKAQLWAGEPSETEPLGQRLFALRSEVPVNNISLFMSDITNYATKWFNTPAEFGYNFSVKLTGIVIVSSVHQSSAENLTIQSAASQFYDDEPRSSFTGVGGYGKYAAGSLAGSAIIPMVGCNKIIMSATGNFDNPSWERVDNYLLFIGNIEG